MHWEQLLGDINDAAGTSAFVTTCTFADFVEGSLDRIAKWVPMGSVSLLHTTG